MQEFCLQLLIIGGSLREKNIKFSTKQGVMLKKGRKEGEREKSGGTPLK